MQGVCTRTHRQCIFDVERDTRDTVVGVASSLFIYFWEQKEGDIKRHYVIQLIDNVPYIALNLKVEKRLQKRAKYIGMRRT